MIRTDIMDIDSEYDANLYEELVEEYLLEDLEVPEECLESLIIDDKYVNIKLSPTQRYFNDDWYVNLLRVG